MQPRIEVVGHLDQHELGDVSLLVEQATEVDGQRPLSEHVMLHLRYGGDDSVRHVLAYAADRLVGYAHVDPTDQVSGSSAELVVDPDSRNQGVGRRLVAEVLAVTPDGRLRLWAHGDHQGAAKLARHFGMTSTRTLWQLRRSLFAPLPVATFPPGVSLRTFRPGADDEAWLALNARAFADHPEQGLWQLTDLHRRTAEPWFDPAGFFLAERGSDGSGGAAQLVGFHWTKTHGEHDHSHGAMESGSAEAPPHPEASVAHGHAPIGEVYVVGVDPAERGTGLGRALTLAGLAHLRTTGLPDVMLYVDADNTAALRLYESLGFARWDSDVLFTTTAAPAPADHRSSPLG